MLRALFVLEGLIDLLFGIAFLLAPTTLLSIYGMSTDRDGTFLGQFLGAIFFGFGLLSWSAAGWGDTRERRTLIRVLFVTSLLGLVLATRYQLQPGAPQLTILFVVLTAVFTVAWGYFTWSTFQRPGPTP